MDIDVDAPLAQALKRIKNASTKKRNSQAPSNQQSEAAQNLEFAQLPATAQYPSIDAPTEFTVSEFDYSVENHFNAVNTIAELCKHPETLDSNQEEIERLANSITFLREWRDFKYAPRLVKFACQYNSEEKGIIGEVTLPQFSAATVPKQQNLQIGSKITGTESSKDFVMHVGGAVWALDWCPRVDRNVENRINAEFVAVAAHPPESSYHKIGAPLTGRGVIQVWCVLTVCEESVPSQCNKKPKPNSQKKVTVKANEPTRLQRPRGRPRKKPLNDSLEKVDTNCQYVQPLAIEYPESSARNSGNTSEHFSSEDSGRTHKDSNLTEHADTLMLITSKGRGNHAKAGKKDQVHNNGLHMHKQDEHQESSFVNALASASCSMNSLRPHKKITCSSSCDPNTSRYSIPKEVALPRMMLCLAHNGKVAWDVKWRPFNGWDPQSMNPMGYLAVLLGNGALEVWEVPLPHMVKLVFPACQEDVDPRFIKLQPVFRCSILKCGDRQSIPLTVEWSVSSPHDMILAGCHDGVVALWKFSITDSSTETRPLLSFSADTGPIRTLAWAPNQSDLESANVIVTAGHRGFKFWDIRDPFRPLWDHPIQGVTYSLDWLPDPRCVFGSIDDGTLWLLNLAKAAFDIPVAGKPLAVTKSGIHNFDCSSFSIWSVHASRLTGMVAYCGEEGTTFCFQPTTRSVNDPSRNRLHHYLCGSLLEEESDLIVVSPLTNAPFTKRSPSMKRRSTAAKNQEKRMKEPVPKDIRSKSNPVGELRSDNSSMVMMKQAPKSKQSSKCKSKDDQDNTLLCRGEDVKKIQGDRISKGKTDEGIEVFPPKIVAMHRVRWNINKGSEKWLCSGGAAGLIRCQEVDLSLFE